MNGWKLLKAAVGSGSRLTAVLIASLTGGPKKGARNEANVRVMPLPE